MIELLDVLAVAIAIVIGVTAFSFMSTIAYRYPKGMRLNEHFRCDHCETQLKFYEVIPVLSFPFLKGRCRYCGEKIRLRDWLNEIAGGMLAVLCLFRFGEEKIIGDSFHVSSILDVMVKMDIFGLIFLLIFFTFICIMDLVILTDYDTMEIPNRYVIVLGFVSVASLFLPGMGIVEHLIGIIVISLPMFLITLAIPGAFGGGDIKLSAAVGLMLGWKLTIIGFLIGLLFGGIYGIYVLVSGKLKKNEHFSFGPFLCTGYLISLFCGMDLIAAYLRLASFLHG